MMTVGRRGNALFFSLLGSSETLGVNPLQWLSDVLLKIRNDIICFFLRTHGLFRMATVNINIEVLNSQPPISDESNTKKRRKDSN